MNERITHVVPRLAGPLVIAVLLLVASSPAFAQLAVAQLGPREVVIADGQWGMRYFPDGGLGIVRDADAVRVLTAVGKSSYLLQGRSLTTLESRGEVLSAGPPSSFDNGYAGINAALRDPGTHDLLAFYHAEDQQGMKAIPGGIPGFYCSIGLARSRDNGQTFEKLGQTITSSLAKDPAGPADQGCGEICLLADRDQKHLLGYYTDHSRADRRGVQICLARCPIGEAANPNSWKKYHAGQFDQPSLGGRDEPVVSGKSLGADAICPSVVFLAHCDRYLMLFSLLTYEELRAGGAPKTSGLYLAQSSDGLHWSQPLQVLPIMGIPLMDREIGCHATLVIDQSDAHSASGWIYYGYSERWGHRPPNKPHYLVRQQVSLTPGTAR